MPAVYATHADVATELASLFGSGFSPTTKPTDTEVTSEIADVTTVLRVRVVRSLGVEPGAGTDAAILLKRGIVKKVSAWVLRRAMVGYAVVDVLKLTQPYEDAYTEVVSEIDLLPDQFAATTVEKIRVGSTAPENLRTPALSDQAIGNLSTF
jgi:hypothetical protein